MKKALSYLIMAVFAFQLTVFAENDTLNNAIDDTAGYILSTIQSPEVGSVGGEWVIFGLARSGMKADDEYYRGYYRRVEQYVSVGKIQSAQPTEYARLVLALGSIGKDPADVKGVNLIKQLDDYDAVTAQGINGAIWALTALGSNDYAAASVKKYILYITEAQRADGGWALSQSAASADADLTAAAIIALSKYRSDEIAAAAVNKAVDYLSSVQNDNGGFSGWDGESSESSAQVLTALCELGISIDDSRFVKNGNTVLDSLMRFYIPKSGFSHILGGDCDQIATEQGFYALSAAQRAENGLKTLYDLSDAISVKDDENDFGLPDKNPDIRYKNVIAFKTFNDISGHKNQTEIESLASRGIISGMTDTEFSPDATMTHAEFATITVNALGLSLKTDNPFNDVNANDWFSDYVSTAYAYGIVSGVSDTEFKPYGMITREEAMAMTARLADISGMKSWLDENSAQNVLAVFDDYRTVSDWALASAAVCVNEGIVETDSMELKPKEYVLRAEIAHMLFRVMERAELI